MRKALNTGGLLITTLKLLDIAASYFEQHRPVLQIALSEPAQPSCILGQLSRLSRTELTS